jgi:hypothetical protein
MISQLSYDRYDRPKAAPSVDQRLYFREATASIRHLTRLLETLYGR